MKNKEIINALYEKLEEENCKGKIVSIQHIQDLKSNIEKKYRSGVFDEEFYRRELINFNFDIPEKFPEAKSLILVAVPQPHVRVIFHPNGTL